MKILLWANGGSSRTRYWGPGTNSYKLYSKNSDKSIKITQVHGVKNLDLDNDVFENDIFISSYTKKTILNKLLFYIKSNIWINKNYKNYDVFHGLGAFEETFTAAYNFTKLGKPAFIHMTGDQAAFLNNSKLSKLLGFPQRRIKRANQITGYISNSKSMVQMLINIGVSKDKIFNIPNHADTDLFKPLNFNDKVELKKKLNLSERFTVLFVGGLCDRKRTYELVVACGNLLKKGLNLDLVLVGPDLEGGIVKAKIIDYITENKLNEFIKIIDYTPLPIQYYQVSDLFVLASKHEGMSGALIEAMATGLPCIVTKISGSEDLIVDGVNGLYTDGTINDLEDKIVKFYNDRKFVIEAGTNARNFVINNCSTELVLNKHIGLFKRYIK